MSSFNNQSQIPDFGIPGSARLRTIVLGSSDQGTNPPTDQYRFPEFSEVDENIDAEPLDEWNKGVFSDTLCQFAPPTAGFKRPLQGPENLAWAPRARPSIAISRPLYQKINLDRPVLLGERLRVVSPPTLRKGTLNGTKVAATEVYKRILQR